MNKTSRNPQVNIRMPDDLKKSLKEIAEEKDRSLNYVIVQALKDFAAKCSEAPAVR
ncbi:TPA: CopG family ribbon-helix-helix protein [Klebsiella pneumoniae]|nr:Arc family DNA-binding protein [Klebsiella pneumoniae]HDS8579147.1 Arc family DNA-binding protein [Klebsiella variicola]EIV5318641.1 Arc family DNA-binding protein [Klebsiella pneumoniae]EKW2648204.1 Arc family DNA-binding protein [Klebsiella pneumoniae]EKW3761552.1 Arc family DNA-binding protein [Klebsiella pneumoniae]EKW6246790.1 Arc family DNA-binding protein [Klebsiella pneumoniae]